MAVQDVERRKAIRAAYDSKAWHDKVDKMDDKQVYAVYMRLKAQKRI